MLFLEIMMNQWEYLLLFSTNTVQNNLRYLVIVFNLPT